VPQPGIPTLTVTHEGRRYRFALEDNRERFTAAPSRYEPAFGGWCAYAVAHGYKFEVDPRSYLVEDDRLFGFYRGLRQADTNWPALR